MNDPHTNVVGIFVDRGQAGRAVAGLLRAGFREDQTALDPLEGDPDGAAGRVLVTVRADRRHGEAAEILRDHGAHGTQWVAR